MGGKNVSNDRREFLKIAGTTAAVAATVTGTAMGTTPAAAQTAVSGQFRGVKALAFDAYGTLFDVFSVTALASRYCGKLAALTARKGEGE
jgi:hypothetical protein